MTTPTMRICIVDDTEDFTVMIVDDPKQVTLDVERVSCGPEADAQVRVVPTEMEADEFIISIEPTLGFGEGGFGTGPFGE